jgi:RNA polymerase sigma-70 factor, ECF subfamily
MSGNGEADTDPSDESLVRQVNAGDESAARQLFERHAQALRTRVRRGLPKRLRPKVAESDVIQDAYVAAFTRLGDFEDRGDGSFARWLHTVLERKILNEVRRHVGSSKRDARREVAAGSSVVRIAGESPDPSPSVVATEAEDRARLVVAMKDLPEAQRTALRLVHEQHLSFDEAAARMDRTPGAVRKLYGRAVLDLSARLRETQGSTG